MTDSEQLTVDLWLLDAVLTGKDSRSGRGDENQIVDIHDFWGHGIFYLSDGGYSRVYCHEGAIHLNSDCTPKVRANWDTFPAGTIRRRIERRLRALSA